MGACECSRQEPERISTAQRQLQRKHERTTLAHEISSKPSDRHSKLVVCTANSSEHSCKPSSARQEPLLLPSTASQGFQCLRSDVCAATHCAKVKNESHIDSKKHLCAEIHGHTKTKPNGTDICSPRDSQEVDCAAIDPYMSAKEGHLVSVAGSTPLPRSPSTKSVLISSQAQGSCESDIPPRKLCRRPTPAALPVLLSSASFCSHSPSKSSALLHRQPTPAALELSESFLLCTPTSVPSSDQAELQESSSASCF